MLEDIIADDGVEEERNELLLLKRKRGGKLNKCIDESLSMHFKVLCLECQMDLGIVERDIVIEDQLLHEWGKLWSKLHQLLLGEPEGCHEVGLLILQLHDCLLQLCEVRNGQPHVLWHSLVPHFLREAFPPLMLVFIGQCDGLCLDVVRKKSENLLDIFDVDVVDIDLLLEFGNFRLDVELWLLLGLSKGLAAFVNRLVAFFLLALRLPIGAG